MQLVDEWGKDKHNGIDGYFVTQLGLDGFLAGHRKELGDKNEALAAEKALHLVDSKALDRMAKSIKPLETMARWGLPIGIGIGTLGAAIFAAIIAAIVKSLPAQIVQAAQ